MKKNTFYKKRRLSKKKGGAADIAATVIFGDKPGPFIPDNIKRAVDTGQDATLIKKYEDRKKNAEDDYKTTNENYQRERDRLNNETYSTATWFIAKLPVFYQIYQIIEKIIIGLYIIISAVGSFIIGIILQSGSLMRRIFDIFTKDRGAVIKAIIFILFIVAIVFLILGVTTTTKAPRKSALEIMKTFPLFNDPTNQTEVTKAINNFNDLIDKDIKNTLRSSYNGFFKFFGNDVVGEDINNVIRETIKEGRNDGLIHLKKKNEDKVYTIVEPKEKEIQINMDDYPKADYHKLPDTIKQLYNPAYIANYSNKIYFIPIKNKNGYKYTIYHYKQDEFPITILDRPEYSSLDAKNVNYILFYNEIYKKCYELKKSDSEKYKALIVDFLNHFEVNNRRDEVHKGDKENYVTNIITNHFSSYNSNANFKTALKNFISFYCTLKAENFVFDTVKNDNPLNTVNMNIAYPAYFALKKDNITNDKFKSFIRYAVNYYEYKDNTKSTLDDPSLLEITKIFYPNYNSAPDTVDLITNIDTKEFLRANVYRFLNEYKGHLIISSNYRTFNDNYKPLINYDTPKGTFFQANDIDIKKFSFSDADNINEKTLENKLFKFSSDLYEYPYDEYIKNKVDNSN